MDVWGRGDNGDIPDTQIFTWGSGEMGQLGYSDVSYLPRDSDGFPYQPVPSAVDALAGVKIVQVAAGDCHSIALSATGQVYTWGASACDQLGHSDTNDMPKDAEGYPYQPVPKLIEGLAGVFIRQVACGDAHTIAVSDSFQVYSWGGGGCGQLGQVDTSEMPQDEDGYPFQPTPREIEKLRGMNIVSVACGKAHSTAISREGKFYSWGAGACGQLGHPDTASFPTDDDGYPYQPIPRVVDALQDIRVIQAVGGDVHTLILSESGEVYSCGGGSYGQLGLGDTSDMPCDSDGCPFMPLPKRVGGSLLNQKVVQIACGDSHSVALTDADDLFCWGSSTYGQLGFDANIPEGQLPGQFAPKRLSYMCKKGIREIACGEAHTLAVTQNGDVYAWGATTVSSTSTTGTPSSTGECNGYSYCSTPKLMKSFFGHNVLKIACGGVHNLAIADGVSCGLPEDLNVAVNVEMFADMCFILEGSRRLYAHAVIVANRCPTLGYLYMQKLQARWSSDASPNITLLKIADDVDIQKANKKIGVDSRAGSQSYYLNGYSRSSGESVQETKKRKEYQEGTYSSMMSYQPYSSQLQYEPTPASGQHLPDNLISQVTNLSVNLSDRKESLDQSKCVDILLDGVKYDQFLLILEYLYTDSIQPVSQITDVRSSIDLLQLCQRFSLHVLQRVCEQTLRSSLNRICPVSIAPPAQPIPDNLSGLFFLPGGRALLVDPTSFQRIMDQGVIIDLCKDPIGSTSSNHAQSHNHNHNYHQSVSPVRSPLLPASPLPIPHTINTTNTTNTNINNNNNIIHINNIDNNPAAATSIALTANGDLCLSASSSSSSSSASSSLAPVVASFSASASAFPSLLSSSSPLSPPLLSPISPSPVPSSSSQPQVNSNLNKVGPGSDQNSLASALNRSLNSKQFSDVTLIVEGKSIYAHKVILSCRSLYFRALFMHEWKEKEAKEVTMTDISYDRACALVAYLYTDRIPDDINLSVDLFVIADRYSVGHLKQKCEVVLGANISIENVASILRHVDNRSRLKQTCLSFIEENFEEVIKTKSFEELEKELMLEILKNHKPRS